MFHMEKVGHKIAALRKEKNMTQMELADRLGISYQAVSNWERGNSMPDIAKLPELAELFGVTVDGILGEASGLLTSAAKGELEKYVEENKVTAEELAQAAPVLKPKQADAVAEELSGKEDGCDIREIQGLLPYISGEVLGMIARKEYAKNGLQNFGIFAFYLKEDDFGEILKEEYEKNGLQNFGRIISFVDEETLDEMARQEYEKNGLDSLGRILSHLDEGTVGEIARQEYAKNGVWNLGKMASYLDEDFWEEIARDIVKKGGMKELVPIASYLGEDVLQEIVRSKYL